MKEMTFINKTTNSVEVSRSTPDERKRINERNREHRRCRGAANKSTAPHEPSALEKSSSLETDDTLGVSAATNRSGGESVERSPAPKAAAIVCPLTGITIGKLGDPFNTTSIPMTAEHWRVIQFYKDIYYKRLWDTVSSVLGSLVSTCDVSQCHPDTVIKECLQISSHMWSLLASASCNLQHETNQDVRDKSLLLVNSGTAGLLTDLQQSQLDRHSLLTSIHLYLAANSMQQTGIADAHLRGARAILRELIHRGVTIPAPTLGLVSLVDGETAIRMLEERLAHGTAMKVDDESGV